MANTPEEIKSKLIEKARQFGFALAGVTSPDPPESFPYFRDWVAAGGHAGMGYLASERSLEHRANPTAILPECESILVLGIPYHPQKPGSEGVAAYAWGEDYHDLFLPRLEALSAYLDEITGEPVPARWYTDTGPILERDLARRAGLGWVGRNSMLIHPEMGSYFLLAEILLGIALPPDGPFITDHCGSCQRCVESCPTSCILPDRTLEAGRCLSYLTIENKGPIPADLREQVGGWLFGCDVCQQVCPWNRFAPEEVDQAFAPRPGVLPADPTAALGLSPPEFNRLFKGSPVKRAKRRGFLRNASVVLGNRGDEEDLPALTAALSDPEPLVRSHAAWALGKIGGKQAEAALREGLIHEADLDVRGEIESLLG